MGKALVIKGTSFAINKLTTVTLSNPVPCEEIVLDKSSVSLTAIGATAAITPTISPVGTTDLVTWGSSDPEVATVVDGVVTATGVGNAIITAVCGTQSATCTVAVSTTIILDEAYSMIAGYYYNSSLDFTKNPTKNYITVGNSDNSVLFYDSENTLDGYRAIYTNAGNRNALAYAYPIPFPAGKISKITINTPDTIPVGNSRICFALTDAKTQQHYSGVDTTDGRCCAGLYHQFMNNYHGAGPLVFNNVQDYPTANSFVVTVRDNGSEDTSRISGITVLFE